MFTHSLCLNEKQRSTLIIRNMTCNGRLFHYQNRMYTRKKICDGIVWYRLECSSNLFWINSINCYANQSDTIYNRIPFKAQPFCKSCLNKGHYSNWPSAEGFRFCSKKKMDNSYFWTLFESSMFRKDILFIALYRFYLNRDIWNVTRQEKLWQNEHVWYNLLTFWHLYKTIVLNKRHRAAHKAK